MRDDFDDTLQYRTRRLNLGCYNYQNWTITVAVPLPLPLLGRNSNGSQNYAGVAIYCEWEMHDQEWDLLQREFGKHQ